MYVILDRDGVINYDSVNYIKSPEEWIPIPGSLEAIATLNRVGYRVLVATNQSGVARGFYDLEMLDRIHEKFIHELATVGGCIEEIFFCPHHPDEKCVCRKPQPGLIKQIKEKYKIDLAQTYFIGDSYTDMQIAINTGCKPLLVLSGNGQKTLAEHPELQHIKQFENLAKAAEFIVSQTI